MFFFSNLFTDHFCDAIKMDNTPSQKIPTDYLYICNRAYINILSGETNILRKATIKTHQVILRSSQEIKQSKPHNKQQ